jgi:hypothetical protein
MPDTPDGERAVEYAVAFPVIEALDFLPYFPSHQAFMTHTEGCERCHIAAFHPEQVEDESWCLTGEGLREKVHAEIVAQHLASTWN